MALCALWLIAIAAFRVIASLEELAQYVRQSVPDSKSMLHLKVNPKMGAVSFIWHGLEFVVQPSLHVFEVRGYSLYITGVSTLLQVVLMRRNANEKVLEAALKSVEEAEDLIRVKNQHQPGAQLLGSVRDTLAKMIGR